MKGLNLSSRFVICTLIPALALAGGPTMQKPAKYVVMIQ
jgi:hypothetical protein